MGDGNVIDPRLRAMARIAAWSLEVCAPTVLEALAGRVSREVCDARIARWSKHLVDEVGARIEVTGREHLEDRSPVVVMSNHQSHFDIPVLFRVLPGSVRMVAKKELFRIPVFGAALHAAEFISVDRGDRAKAIESLQSARSLIASGISVWIAPEGTRSLDGRLGEFKKGGFILAEEAGVAILPVSIDGTRHILPAKTSKIQFEQRVRVTVHARVRRDEVASRAGWMERVRSVIASGIATP